MPVADLKDFRNNLPSKLMTDVFDRLVGELENAAGPETTKSKLSAWGWTDDFGGELSWDWWQRAGKGATLEPLHE